MVFQEFLPTLGAAFRSCFFAAAQPFYALVAQSRVERAGRCEVVAQGDGHAVRGIEPSGGLIYREDTADDGGDLFLGGGTAPRDALLDAHRGVFRNGEAAAQRSCHSYALRPPEFEHRLHVFAEEGRFQRHFARGVLVNQRPDPLEDIT